MVLEQYYGRSWKIINLIICITRSILPKLGSLSSELSSSQQPSSEVIGKADSAIVGMVVDEETSTLDLTAQEDNTFDCITEEWEQLVLNEDPETYSPSFVSKSRLNQSCVLTRVGNRQLEEQTSRILERLEVPTSVKSKVAFPVSTGSCMTKTSVPTKKPLIPFHPSEATEHLFIGSQLRKPNFKSVKMPVI
ncbi:hypothetical protein L6164_014952 [Bauhinia variegata]|uniref:Uncharacterized protein n=1 Tax=Bauhinia variegata TaxID=167791 RepID=A0ACB9NK63_BAUVA|nr:hypothetical protein L6164_014952 [Bauhinia variegata]